MKKGIWHRRIPTIAALGLLLVGLWVSSLLVQSGIFYVGRASPNKIPQNVSISNITDKSFSVSFTTVEKTLSGILVEEGASDSFLVFDDRNKQTNRQDEYLSHHITVADLKPNTTYSFSILSGGESYLDNGEKYSVTTGPPIVENPPKQNPITGKVLLTNGEVGNDVVVELSIEQAQKISVLTDEEGKYTIPTNSIRTATLDKYFQVPLGTEITVTAFRQNSMSKVISLFSDINQIPTITLEESYDFTAVSPEEKIATLSSQLQVPTPRIGIGEVRITIPREDQTFVDARPQFRGTALARETVQIFYDGTESETESDGNGVWVFRPENDIPPGVHTLTIESVDRFGIVNSVSQEFTVFSSGSQVAQTATPSATPTITTAPTNTPTPTQQPTATSTPEPTPEEISPTISPTPNEEDTTATPTSTITPTPTSVPAATFTPTPTIVVDISPPAPGSTSAIVLTVVSVVLIFAGGALLFLL